MPTHSPLTKQKKIITNSGFFLFTILLFFSCTSNPAAEKKIIDKDLNAATSILIDTDTATILPIVADRITEIKAALQLPQPILLCKDSLDPNQSLAQIIALSDADFTRFSKDSLSKQSYRCEVFGVYPARQSDMSSVKTKYNLGSTYRVEMYNYALNATSIALVDVQQQKTLISYLLNTTQPDISNYLKTIAIRIAVESPEVQKALGIKPSEADALMASTKTSLNRSRCERSHHLCVAPTFVKGDKALWAIVDLTDFRVAGIRWTNVGTTGPAAPMITEKKLQDDKITSCYCEVEQQLKKNNWDMMYMLTSSDGLRISNVSFNGKPILRSAKLVDWHVSYSGTDGFGYSDAVGCPYFSQAAVVAWEIPKIAELKDDNNKIIGFTLDQNFRSEGWPTACNYNYRQRYEFYNDGKFRVSCASLGRGCGNTGTYRPVFRIAFAAQQNNFFQWNNHHWEQWKQEKWNEQNSMSSYTSEGYLYKIGAAPNGYYVEPGRGQFNDKGRGDFSFVYITKNNSGKEEGENDLPTIGPCCNTDYHQGPEKFIEPQPEAIENTSLVFWYVAQLRNDDRKGTEYCWAENVLENGVWVTKTYPCFAGPMFIPVK